MSNQSSKNNPDINQQAILLLEEMSRLAVLDNRSADEILGYDELGLPS